MPEERPGVFLKRRRSGRGRPEWELGDRTFHESVIPHVGTGSPPGFVVNSSARYKRWRLR